MIEIITQALASVAQYEPKQKRITELANQEFIHERSADKLARQMSKDRVRDLEKSHAAALAAKDIEKEEAIDNAVRGYRVGFALHNKLGHRC